MNLVLRPLHKSSEMQPSVFEEAKKSSEMALIEILSEFHNKINIITETQALGLRNTSNELDIASKQFLEDLKNLFEAEKQSSAARPFLKSMEYIASFMTIALGIGLCTTGIASIVGTIMISTGVFGCIHTTLELTDTYKHLANLTEDKHTQEIIKTYLPAMVATSLALSASITGAYSASVALNSSMNTVRLFLPLIIQSLQTTQVITKGIFDLHKNQAEAKKIDHDALGKCLEKILEEQHLAMTNNMNHQSKMHKDAIYTLKTLISLHKHL